jgi:GT2 family glycosyltransferase
MSARQNVVVVVIGRNEGVRLEACLASLKGQNVPIVYVDSGSDDDSVAVATNVGAQIVELDLTEPFTAARARNAGFNAIQSQHMPQFVQFIDGDCVVVDDWINKASDALSQNPTWGLVTGWRSEIFPDQSLYNALCDFEWHRPSGEIVACGGDMMVRTEAFAEIGGFDATVIAAEDDEFCLRLSKANWKLHRLPEQMTRHDAAMTRFGQWWQRAVRSGHGFAQVGYMHPPYFITEQRRALVFAAMLPVLALIGVFWSWWIVALVIAAYAASYIRTVQGLLRSNLRFGPALHQSCLLSLSKFPNLQGIINFHWRRLRGRKMQIIEYK